MSRPPRKAPRSDKMSTLADILPVLAQDLSLEKRVNELALLALWSKQAEAVAGEVAAAHSKAIRLKKQGHQTILLVKVANAALASELSFHVAALTQALNRFAPQTGITVDRIQLSVGTVSP